MYFAWYYVVFFPLNFSTLKRKLFSSIYLKQNKNTCNTSITLLLVLYRTTFRYENVSRPLAIWVWSIITWAILLRWTIRASTVGRAWSRDSTRGLNGSDSKCRARDFGDKGRLSLWEAWNYKMSSSMFLVRRNAMKVRQVFYNQVLGLFGGYKAKVRI